MKKSPKSYHSTSLNANIPNELVLKCGSISFRIGNVCEKKDRGLNEFGVQNEMISNEYIRLYIYAANRS